MKPASKPAQSFRVGAAIFATFLGASAAPLALGGATTDGSVGPVRALSGKFTIPETLGTRAGQNLFHSFTRFNIDPNESATFTTTSNTIQNVISRVTGGEQSVIHGLLKLDAAPGSRPDFYFINPSGVVFGAGTQLDVPAGFHVSTAQQLKFADGSIWDTASPTASGLTVAAPEAFGFLGQQSGAIRFHSLDPSGLSGANPSVSLASNSRLDLVASAIRLEDAKLVASNGDIRLIATGSQAGTVNLKTGPGAWPLGRIDLINAKVETSESGSATLQGGLVALERSSVTSRNHGATAGHLMVSGESGIALNRSTIASNTRSTEAAHSAANISITTKGPLTIANGSEIRSRSESNAPPGAIDVRANSIVIGQPDATTDSGIFNTFGSITVAARDTLDLLGGGQIACNSTRLHAAGPVNVQARSIQIDRVGAEVATGIFSIADRNTSDAGAIHVRVTDDLNILRGGEISGSTSAGAGGSIDVQAGSIKIERGTGPRTGILSRARGGSYGDAGDIHIRTTGALQILNSGVISSATAAKGSTGSIDIEAGSIAIGGRSTGFHPAIENDADGEGDRNFGRVKVTTKGLLDIFDGGQISASTSSTQPGGQVDIEAGEVRIDRAKGQSATGIFSIVGPSGSNNAGAVRLHVAGQLGIQGGEISCNTGGSGNAGAINIEAESLTIDGRALATPPRGIVSEAQRGTGSGGQIDVNVSNDLLIVNGGRISTSTSTTGSAGQVAVRAGSLTIDGRNGDVSTGIASTAKVSSSGQPGTVAVIVDDQLRVIDSGEITVANHSGNDVLLGPQNVSVRATDVELNSGKITAEAQGRANAGSVNVVAANNLSLSESEITTQAQDGNGGPIVVSAGDMIRLNDSKITTSVAGQTNGNGGDIRLKARTLVMQTGFVQANTAATQATGGNVSIDVGLLISNGAVLLGGDTALTFDPSLTGVNAIQAAAPGGVSGNVQVSSPIVDIAGNLRGLSAEVIDYGLLGKDLCRVGFGSSFTPVGRGGLRVSAREWIRDEARVAPAEWRIGEPRHAPASPALRVNGGGECR